jgi:hypothetical protein
MVPWLVDFIMVEMLADRGGKRTWTRCVYMFPREELYKMKSHILSCPERMCDFVGQGRLSRLVVGAASTKVQKKGRKKKTINDPFLLNPTLSRVASLTATNLKG